MAWMPRSMDRSMVMHFDAATKRENKNPQKKVYHTWDEPPHTAGECKRCGGPIGANYWKLREGREGWELEAGCEFFFRRRKVTLRESQGAQLFSTCSPSFPHLSHSFLSPSLLSPLSSLTNFIPITRPRAPKKKGKTCSSRGRREEREKREKKERTWRSLSLFLSIFLSLSLPLPLSLSFSFSFSLTLSPPSPPFSLSFLLDPRPHHTFST